MKINRINTTPEIDPYHRGTGTLTQTYLTIDLEDGELWIDQECDDNATPEPVWNGRMVMEKLSDGSVLDADEIRNYLESDEAQELHDRIMDGATIEWNGSNHVGYLDDDALDALNDLTLELKDFYNSEIEVYTCEDYLYEACTADMTDAEIEACAAEIANNKNLIILDGDPAEYMRTRREELRDKRNDQ